MKKRIAYVGIDYHKNTLTIAVRIEGEKEIHDTPWQLFITPWRPVDPMDKMVLRKPARPQSMVRHPVPGRPVESQGPRKNKFAELMLRFRSDLVDAIERRPKKARS